MHQTDEKDRVRPLIVRGEEARRLAQRLFHPTKGQIEEHKKFSRRIRETIGEIHETEDGFYVEIDESHFRDPAGLKKLLEENQPGSRQES